jgi:hypothetical protein
MITEEQISQLTQTQKDLLLLNLINKVSEISADLRTIKLRHIVENMDRVSSIDTKTSSPKEEVSTEETKSYPSVEDAPEWKLVFKVNTSEGISTQKVIQKAWTEKQAMFLGRTEQLFNMMNELVKAKQIQPKWNIAEVSAEKIV